MPEPTRKRVVVNDVARHTGVGDVFCMPGEFDAEADYVVRVALLQDGESHVELPVRSVGRHRESGAVYLACDERFLNHHGFECLFPPVDSVELDIAMNPQTGKWYGRVLGPNRWELFKTPGRNSADEAETLLRNWCLDQGHVLPATDDDDEPPPTVPFQAEAA